jgi:hypothetical protein
VIEAAKEALIKFGFGTGGSRVTSGTHLLFSRFLISYPLLDKMIFIILSFFYFLSR